MGLVSSNKVDVNRYALEVSVSKEEFAQAVEAAFRKNAKNISIAGFRKGKAPRKIIEQFYGKGVFYEDAVNATYPQYYTEAVEEAGIIPVDRADIDVKEVSEEGYRFVATVTTKPEVEVGEYKGLKVEKQLRTASEEDVTGELTRMQERGGRLVNVEDRSAKNGDSVVIDFEGFVDGTAFEGGKAEMFTLKLGSGQFIPGFEEQVENHSVGEEFDVVVPFPEDYHAPDLAGKEATFKIKLHEIKETELPELDDEFAKDVSEFDTLGELKDDIQKKLQENYDRTAQNEMEDKLIDLVVGGMKAEIPQCMFEHRIDEMVANFDQRLQSQGMNLQLYMQYTGVESMESFRKTFTAQAERQVKIRLALEKIVELENITASDDDLTAELERLAAQYGMAADKLRELLPLEDVKQDIAVNKAVDLVRDSAVITETKA